MSPSSDWEVKTLSSQTLPRGSKSPIFTVRTLVPNTIKSMVLEPEASNSGYLEPSGLQQPRGFLRIISRPLNSHWPNSMTSGAVVDTGFTSCAEGLRFGDTGLSSLDVGVSLQGSE